MGSEYAEQRINALSLEIQTECTWENFTFITLNYKQKIIEIKSLIFETTSKFHTKNSEKCNLFLLLILL